MNDDWGSTWNRHVDVTADAEGRISDTFQLPDWFVATYSVVATGCASGTATTTFTDGNVKVASKAIGTSTTPRPFTPARRIALGTAGSPVTKTADTNGTTTGVGNNESTARSWPI